MNGSKGLPAILKDAVHNCDVQGLLCLEALSSGQKLSLRNELRTIRLSKKELNQLVEWAWIEEPAIQKAARNLILLFFNTEITVACLEKFSNGARPNLPFILRYDSAEREFHVEISDTPGFGVSHYGRGNPETDQLLFALERAYRKMYPKTEIRGFRR